MGSTRRHKFRRPVLSRLTMAWLGVGAMFVVLGGIFISFAARDRGHGRVAMPIDEIEIFASAPLPATAQNNEDKAAPTAVGLRLSAPDLRKEEAVEDPGANAPEGLTTNDILLYPEELSVADNAAPSFSEEEIVITIDGKPQGAAPVINASLTPTPLAIPDPYPALLRSTPLGKIPRIAPDGRKAMTSYARPFTNPDNLPRIAIIVGGLGLNPALTERAIDELPPEISLAFAPYAKELSFWTEKARRSGHEVLIELPMESYGGNQQALGAAALLSTRSAQENLQRLDWLLARFGGYFAATNYMGGKFSADENALLPILQKLRDAGVAYIDDTGAARLAGEQTAVSWTTVNRMIPPAPDESRRRAVRRELKALEKIAQRDGAALGKTYVYAATLDEIIQWSNGLNENGFIAAPASSVLQARTSSR
ncbi:MAG: divergent polysaccharide deacetylase family protein [Marinicaulis sp.]|nr:divergent polysaccharide deacetylase family protein [Marinicaulis sp.]